MRKSEIIHAFAALGEWLSGDSEELNQARNQAYIKNNWFTPQNIELCLSNWSKSLTEKNLEAWLSEVPEENTTPKTVGIIMAGNIPMVGFHDLLCVVSTGHFARIKCSQNDEILIKACITQLKEIEPGMKDRIEVVDRMNKPDAIIATGSNNTARYFEHYFGDIPRIIRKNRTSVAVLDGSETEEELKLLADDVFQYFGLGCRNVTKLLIPENYDLISFLNATAIYGHVADHNKFANNYTYHKAIFLMNLTPHLDTGYLLVKEDEKLHSPLACLFYEHYSDKDQLKQWLSDRKDEIQVVVSKIKNIDGQGFGTTQQTGLADYADGVNTLAFLMGI